MAHTQKRLSVCRTFDPLPEDNFPYFFGVVASLMVAMGLVYAGWTWLDTNTPPAQERHEITRDPLLPSQEDHRPPAPLPLPAANIFGRAVPLHPAPIQVEDSRGGIVLDK